MEKTDLNYLRNFIAEGNIRQALDELLGILNSDARGRKQLRDDAILLRTQLNEVERKENLNLITSDEAGHDRAHLQKAILDLINEMEESLRPPAVAIPALAPSAGEGMGKVLMRVIPIVLATLLIILGVVFRKQLFGPGSQPEPPAQENKSPVTAIPDQPSGAAEDNQTTQPSNIGDRPAEVTQQTGETAHSTGSTGQQGGGSKGGDAIKKTADLSVSDWRFTPDPPVQNQATRIDFTVENKGSKAAENFSVQWWAGVNYPGAEKTWTNVTLAAGERKSFRFVYAGYPSWYGSLQTKIVVDPNQRVDDKDRNNNVQIRTISVNRNIPAVAGQADLSVSDWRFTPDPPVQNQATRIDFTVENKGSKAAENFTIQWWAGVNAPQPAKTWTNVTLAAGERKKFTYNYAGYPSWYGQLQTKVVVDPGKQVNDANRSNNEKVLTIRVLKPG